VKGRAVSRGNVGDPNAGSLYTEHFGVNALPLSCLLMALGAESIHIVNGDATMSWVTSRGPYADGAGRAKAAVWEEMTASTRAILREVLLCGPLTRAELARRLFLSPASLTMLTRPLIRQGLLVRETTSLQARSGRPSEPLEVDAAWQQVIGVKLTADDLFAVTTDLRGRVMQEYQRELATCDVDEVVEQVSKAISTLDRANEVGAVGISLAANVLPDDSAVREAPYLGWKDVPLARLVGQRVGCPVVLSNDVRALTAAQHWFGAGNGSSNFAVLTVGKGVGCGLVVNDAIVGGNDGHAGLVSHLPVRDGGPFCQRGHRGCASSYLTSGAIVRSLSVTNEGGANTFDKCLLLACNGDPPARRAFADACYALGVVTAHVVNLLGPDRVVLSGEAIGMYELNPEAVAEAIADRIHGSASSFELVVAPFAFSEWARGAAVAAIQSLVGGGPGGSATARRHLT
jgi:predicted NBD/HSP70 family sugar kinase